MLTASELNLVRQVIADFPRLSQAELAYTICELLQWRRPNGKLKSPECVEWLQKWQKHDCLPNLPELRINKPRGAHAFMRTGGAIRNHPYTGDWLTTSHCACS